MAGGFSFTGEMILKAPNLRGFASSIQQQLNGINASINIKLPSNALSGLSGLNAQAKALNAAATALGNNNGPKAASKAYAGVASSISDAAKAAGSFGEVIGNSARKFGAFSIAAGTLIGLISTIKDGTAKAIEFQREMIRLEQVGGNLGNSVKAISDEIGRLGSTFGASSSELSKAATTLRQAGVSAEDTKTALEALAKTTLAPTFSNLSNTLEGTISVMQQFGVQAKQLDSVLSSVNSVSAAFAVESDDIVHAVRRSGGAFKAAGGNLNELISLFTSVRQTTRESAETIASGFNTIFARAQRADTVDKLKDLGINLRFSAAEAKAFGKTEGDFVGPYEAVRRLNTALKNVPPASAQYAAIVEELGGFRQVSKVIPLIQQFAKSEQALGIALGSTASLSQSAIIGQKALSVQVDQLRESFLGLFRSIGENKTLQRFAELFLTVANAAVSLARALEPLVPLIATLAIFKTASLIGSAATPQFAKGFARGFTNTQGPGVGGPGRFAHGGEVRGFGNADTVDIKAKPGEFVLNKGAAQRIGLGKLHKANRYAAGGTVGDNVNFTNKPGFAANRALIKPTGTGGKVAMLVTGTRVGASTVDTPVVPIANLASSAAKRVAQDKASLVASGKITQDQSDAINNVTVPIAIRSPNSEKGSLVRNTIKSHIVDALASLSNTFSAPSAGIGITKKDTDEIVNKSITNNGIGRIFESFLHVVATKTSKGSSIGKNAQQNFDFAPINSRGLSSLFGDDLDGIYGDAKYIDNTDSRASIVSKAVRQFGISSGVNLGHLNLDKKITTKSGKELTGLDAYRSRFSYKTKKFAAGGAVAGDSTGIYSVDQELKKKNPGLFASLFSRFKPTPKPTLASVITPATAPASSQHEFNLSTAKGQLTFSADAAHKYIAGDQETLNSLVKSGQITSQSKTAVTKNITKSANAKQGLQGTDLHIPFGGDSVGVIGKGTVGESGSTVVDSGDLGKLIGNAKVSKSLQDAKVSRVHLKLTRHIISNQATKDFEDVVTEPVRNVIGSTLSQKFPDVPASDFQLSRSEAQSLDGVLFQKYVTAVSKTRLASVGKEGDSIFDFPHGIKASDGFNKIVLPSPVGEKHVDAKIEVGTGGVAQSLIKKYLSQYANDHGALPFATGGIVPGTGNGDTVPAALQPGSFVLRKSASKQLTQKYADGGSVPSLLTPGEIVFGPSDAKSIGYGNLHKMNKMAGGGIIGKLFGQGQSLQPLDIEKIKKQLEALGVKIPNLTGDVLPGNPAVSEALHGNTGKLDPRFKNAGGLFVPATKQVVLSDPTDLPLAAHEFAHASDFQFGPGQQFASEISGTRQNATAQLALQNLTPSIHSPADTKKYKKAGVDLSTDPVEAYASAVQHFTRSQIPNIPQAHKDFYAKPEIQDVFKSVQDSFGAVGNAAAPPSKPVNPLGLQTYRAGSEEQRRRAELKDRARTRTSKSYAQPLQIKDEAGNLLPNPLSTRDPLARRTFLQNNPLANSNFGKGFVGGGPSGTDKRLPEPPPEPDCCEKSLLVLRDILVAIKNIKTIGTTSKNKKKAEESTVPLVPTVEKPLGRFGKLGERFSQFGGTAAVIGSQFAPQLLEKAFGTPETHKAGNTFLGGNAASVGAGLGGAFQGAGLGASVGGLVGGPIGAAVGGLVGAIHGATSAFQESEKRIKEIKIDKELDKLGKTIDKVNGDELAFNPSNIGILKGGLTTIRKEANSSEDTNKFLNEKVNTAQLTSLLTKVITTSDVGGNTAAERQAKITTAQGGLGGDIIGILQKLPENANKTFNELFKQFDDLAVKVSLEKKRTEELTASIAAIEIQTKNFDRLAEAALSAVASLNKFDEGLNSTTNLFEGTSQITSPSHFSANASKLGAIDTTGVNRSVDFVSSAFGNGGGQVAKDFSTSLKATNLGIKSLPSILANLASQGTLSPDDKGKRFDDALQAIVGDKIPNEIRRNLKSAFSGIDDDELNKNLKNNPGKLVDTITESLKSTTQALEPAAKALEDGLNSFAQGLNKYRELQAKAEEAQLKVVDIQTEGSAVASRILSRRANFGTGDISVGTASRPFNARQESLAGVSGPNAFNVNALATRANAANKAVSAQQEKISSLSNVQQIVKAQNALVPLVETANKLRGALDNLTKAGERSAAIQDRLSKIEAEEEQRLGLAERYLLASPQERSKIDQTANAASLVARGQGNFFGASPELQTAIINLTHELENIPTAILNGQTGGQFRKGLLQNFSPRLAGIANLRPATQVERQSLETQQLKIFADASKAQSELAISLGDLKNTFFKDLENNQKTFLADLQKNILQATIAQTKAEQIPLITQQGNIGKQQEAEAGLQSKFGVSATTASKLAGNKDILDLKQGVDRQNALSNAKLSPTEDIQRKEFDFKTQSVRSGTGRFLGNVVADEDKGKVQDLSDKLISNISKQANGLSQEQIIGTVKSSLSEFARDFSDKERTPENLNNLLKTNFGKIIGPELIKQFETNRTAAQSIGKDTGVDVGNIIKIASNFDEFSKGVKGLGIDFIDLAGKFKTVQAQIQGFTDKLTVLNQSLNTLPKPKTTLATAKEAAFSAFSKGGIVYRASGGSIFKAKGTDTVPAMLTPGERVMTRKQVSDNGPLLDKIAKSGGPIYAATGGYIDPSLYGGTPTDYNARSSGTINDGSIDAILNGSRVLTNAEKRAKNIPLGRPRQPSIIRATPPRPTSTIDFDIEIAKKEKAANNFLSLASKAESQGNFSNANLFYQKALNASPSTEASNGLLRTSNKQNLPTAGEAQSSRIKAQIKARPVAQPRNAGPGFLKVAGTKLGAISRGIDFYKNKKLTEFTIDDLNQANRARQYLTAGEFTEQLGNFDQSNVGQALAQEKARRSALSDTGAFLKEGASPLISAPPGSDIETYNRNSKLSPTAPTRKKRPLTINDINRASLQQFNAGYYARGGDVVPIMAQRGETILPKNFGKSVEYHANGGTVGGGSAGNSIGVVDTASLTGFLTGFNAAVQKLAAFGEILSPLTQFSQNIQSLITPFTQFSGAATNLGIGLTSFTQQIPGLIEGLKALSNMPSTITIAGSINPIPINVNVTQTISDEVKTQIINQAIAAMKSQLKSGDILGGG